MTQKDAIPPTLNLKTERAAAKAGWIKLIEMAFLEQAGIMITKLDNRRASVTYSDPLPLTLPSSAALH